MKKSAQRACDAQNRDNSSAPASTRRSAMGELSLATRYLRRDTQHSGTIPRSVPELPRRRRLSFGDARMPGHFMNVRMDRPALKASAAHTRLRLS
jgi:hypothetical protein